MKVAKEAKRIMVAGHVCLDMTPVFSSHKAKALAKVLSPGKLVQVNGADVHAGGAVANAGLALHIFGADVRLVAKVGKDLFGQAVRAVLEEHGCPVELIMDESCGTSYSVVLAIPGIDRIFLHYSGANDTFVSSDITDEMLQEVGHLHFGYPPLMRRMYQHDGEELRMLLQRAKNMHVTTSLDMAAVDPDGPAGQVDWKRILARVLPFVDFFLPSAEEVCYMLDRQRYNDWVARAKGGDVACVLSPAQDVAPLANELIGMGAKVVFIKCGAPGIYYQAGTSEAAYALCAGRGLQTDEWIGIEGFEKSYRQDNIVSGTGAGDVSIAAFLASMVEKQSLLHCAQMAAAAGACCISAYDALSGLEGLDAMQSRIKAGWEKV